MLADVGGRDEHLRERHRIVRQEVELQVFLRVGVGIDDARDVDDEADRLASGVSAWFTNSGQSWLVPAWRCNLRLHGFKNPL